MSEPDVPDCPDYGARQDRSVAVLTYYLSLPPKAPQIGQACTAAVPVADRLELEQAA